MPYSAEQMQQAAVTLEEASVKVRTALLLIGEKHTEAHGRGLVANLIRRELVDNLFLEIPGNGWSDDDVGSPAWIRQRSQTSADITRDAAWEENKSMLNGSHRNEVPFSRLIEFAVRHGVRVHFIDNKPGYDEANLSPEQRSNLMREKLDAAGAGPRSVFLVGSAHLNHARLKNRPNVQMVRCIGAEKK
jgi:hypothetical protein